MGAGVAGVLSASSSWHSASMNTATVLSLALALALAALCSVRAVCVCGARVGVRV